MELSALLEQVTPGSLTGDIVLGLFLLVILSMYIIQKGLKDIVIISLALYISQALIASIPWSILPIDITATSIWIFSCLTILNTVLLRKSPISQSLLISKKNKAFNIVFGVSVVGLFLVSIFGLLTLNQTTAGYWVERSLFSSPTLRIVWTLLPITLYPFMKVGVKK